MATEQPILVFDDTSKSKLFKALGLKRGSEGQLVDSNNQSLVDQDFETIKYSDFGGILQGSKIPISKKTESIIKYFSSRAEEDR